MPFASDIDRDAPPAGQVAQDLSYPGALLASAVITEFPILLSARAGGVGQFAHTNDLVPPLSKIPVECSPVRRNRTYQFRRTLAPCLLVLLQVHLLGVAMLHRHGETTALRHGLWVAGCEVQPSPASDSNLLCAACQIVQNSAAQPASAAQVLASPTSVPLVRRMTPSNYRSELPAMGYGRAPPLF
jgi:hypothetical protein